MDSEDVFPLARLQPGARADIFPQTSQAQEKENTNCAPVERSVAMSLAVKPLMGEGTSVVPSPHFLPSVKKKVSQEMVLISRS